MKTIVLLCTIAIAGLVNKDCDKKTFFYNDFRVEYKICQNRLNDTAYYYLKNYLLLKEHWSNGRSAYSEQTSIGSSRTRELINVRAAFFDQVKLVSPGKLQTNKEIEIKIENFDMKCSLRSQEAMLMKTKNGIIVTPKVPKGDTVKVYANYFGADRDILLIKEKVQ